MLLHLSLEVLDLQLVLFLDLIRQFIELLNESRLQRFWLAFQFFGSFVGLFKFEYIKSSKFSLIVLYRLNQIVIVLSQHFIMFFLFFEITFLTLGKNGVEISF